MGGRAELKSQEIFLLLLPRPQLPDPQEGNAGSIPKGFCYQLTALGSVRLLVCKIDMVTEGRGQWERKCLAKGAWWCDTPLGLPM